MKSIAGATSLAGGLSSTALAKSPNDASEKHERRVDKEVERQKLNSYQSAESGIGAQDISDPRFQLYLGINDTIYDAQNGDSGKYSSGWTPKAWGSSYDTSDDQAEAAIVTGTVGAGSGTAWAWIGREFYVNGSGSQTANIIGRGDIVGMLTAAGTAACEGRVNLVVIDYGTGGTRYDDTIFSKGDGGYESTSVDDSFNQGMSMVLEGGHGYMVALEVEAEVTLSGSGEGGSDFGDGDHDGGDAQGVFFDSIEFRF